MGEEARVLPKSHLLLLNLWQLALIFRIWGHFVLHRGSPLYWLHFVLAWRKVNIFLKTLPRVTSQGPYLLLCRLDPEAGADGECVREMLEL